MAAYPHHIPPMLKEDLASGKVIPIVGAGFSKNAILPAGKSMPDWHELAQGAASYFEMKPSGTDALSILSDIEHKYGQTHLVGKLAELLHIFEAKPGPAHHAFCKAFFGKQILTTNFDFLLEHAFLLDGYPLYSINSKDSLAFSSIMPDNCTRLFKLHGDFQQPENLVITEQSYDTFFESNPGLVTYVSNLFIQNTLILIGYSFDDYDIRSLYQIIKKQQGLFNRKAYCVLVDAGEDEIRRFENRNISVIHLPGSKSDYSQILEQFFCEISSYLTSKKNQQPSAKYKFALTIAHADTEEVIIIPKELFIVGSCAQCDYAIKGNALVSTRHAAIAVDFETSEAFIYDLNSTNGTYLNNIPITGKQRLKDGAVFAVANQQITFHILSS